MCKKNKKFQPVMLLGTYDLRELLPPPVYQ